MSDRKIASFHPLKLGMIVGFALDDGGELWELQAELKDDENPDPEAPLRNVYNWAKIPDLPVRDTRSDPPPIRQPGKRTPY